MELQPVVSVVNNHYNRYVDRDPRIEVGGVKMVTKTVKGEKKPAVKMAATQLIVLGLYECTYKTGSHGFFGKVLGFFEDVVHDVLSVPSKIIGSVSPVYRRGDAWAKDAAENAEKKLYDLKQERMKLEAEKQKNQKQAEEK